MKCVILTLLCAAGTAVALSAQSPIPAASEPHHKRLLYTNDVRLFDVTVPPGQSVADHVHDYDLAAVILSDGTLSINRNGADVATGAASRGTVVVTEQTGAPATFRIQNGGTTDYHVLEVENMREDGRWLMPDIIMAPATTVLKQSRAFTIYDVRLRGDMTTTMHAHTWSTIAILLDGVIEQGGIGGEEPARLQGAGQWLTLPRGQAHTLTAIGGDAHVIEIEAR